MKPDDADGRLPSDERPFRVLIIAGSDRCQYNCPGVDSKARALMLRVADRLPHVSTPMALCCWPCNCYEQRTSAGRPREGSSPASQQEGGLNRDATWHPKRSEGARLRR